MRLMLHAECGALLQISGRHVDARGEAPVPLVAIVVGERVRFRSRRCRMRPRLDCRRWSQLGKINLANLGKLLQDPPMITGPRRQ